MKKIGLIVVSDYYKEISKNLLKNCITTLKKKGLKAEIKTVKGSLEIPTLIAHQINKKKYKFFIALGCIIKGKTPHFEFISSAIVNSLLNLSVTFKIPVVNGIINSLNYKQAIERSSKSKNKNKGIEAAEAIISLLKYI